MGERRNSNGTYVVGLALILLFVSSSLVVKKISAQAQQDKQAPASAAQTASAPAASPAPSAYAGSDACKTCHADEYSSWEKSLHFRTSLDTKGGPSKQGCEACHGPAANHVADPSDTSGLFIFEKASATDINARCLTCHASGTGQMNASNSFHRLNQVSCTDCHSPHHATTPEHLLVKAQPELCYTCHLQQKSQFNMPFHHRVNEGLIQCTDCHNQHGTDGTWQSDHLVRQVQNSNSGDVACFKCHKDKQGPFVFEHAAVRLEGCATCHIPHGGANPHMLKYSDINLLCLQCHTAAHFGPITATGNNGQPTGFAVMNGPVPNNAIYIQACTMCHTQIHGSNFSDIYFR